MCSGRTLARPLPWDEDDDRLTTAGAAMAVVLLLAGDEGKGIDSGLTFAPPDRVACEVAVDGDPLVTFDCKGPAPAAGVV